MIEVVRRPHATGFPVWAADRPEVVVLSADLTSSCEADTFRDTHRDRFFSMGMAEQNMMITSQRNGQASKQYRDVSCTRKK